MRHFCANHAFHTGRPPGQSFKLFVADPTRLSGALRVKAELYHIRGRRRHRAWLETDGNAADDRHQSLEEPHFRHTRLECTRQGFSFARPRFKNSRLILTF